MSSTESQHVSQARRWIFRHSDQAPAETESWAHELGVSPLLAALLWQRGLRTLRDMDVFLSPGLRHLAKPGDFPGLDDAARVLAQGLEQGLPMAVWGDYDVDGVTATALVTDVLARRGFAVRHYLPNRMEEGYGLNLQGIEQLAAEGVRLLLTVDCGITSTVEIARARELGMTVVVTDHHLPGSELPAAHGMCNPRLAPCPCDSLAGVGVAFLLMAAVNRLLPGAPCDMREVLDLVALGTLADVVDLNGQNRILVKNGLLLIAEGRRPGIFALKEAACYNPTAPMGAGQVVFGLAPRINAAGRLGQADLALELLLAPDRETARPLAAKLDAMNSERKHEEERITAEALAQADTQLHRVGLVLSSPGWHHGVIGIVASRMVEAFYRPVLILSEEDGLLKGSGRSIDEFDLHQGLCACAALLTGFGGHRQAAGLRLRASELDALREAFDQAVRNQVGDAPLAPRMKLDGLLAFGLIDQRLLRELELLQPFGMGNPEPVFLHSGAMVRAHRIFAGKHVSLDLRDEASGVTLKAKAWRQAESLPHAVLGKPISLAFTPKINSYNGLDQVELHIKDWKPA
ncbi:exonuclease RecJ [Desulfocurvibacter africanus PCS]|uniref:Single-stranded-DNA-specific exonuclease RecJ n=1 Tax=Desulfocurvibacter africanus PCS TaxID=1262666 RepID=M5PRT0_DESAF|nr:single-stranded-DNA-specific exonuclease RecJ [Desulfocurvibacter africanus]EMG36780.1 exonuclease RecJ [Desulfocurvibacter africanus PCS]